MRRSLEKEMMDLPGNPRGLLEEDLKNLRAFNRYLGGYRGLMGYLRNLVGTSEARSLSLLDVGTGSGDIPVAIARWGRDEKIDLKIVGLERDPVTVDVAREHTRGYLEVSLVRADVFHPPFPSSSFDFVHASQLLHHLGEEEIVEALRVWSKIARRGILVSDLIRHPLAYYGVGALTRLCTANEMTRTDAPLSVRRAFTLGEWQEVFRRAAVGEFNLTPLFPFRMFATVRLRDYPKSLSGTELSGRGRWISTSRRNSAARGAATFTAGPINLPSAGEVTFIGKGEVKLREHCGGAV